jgi:hypothetical protein
LSIAGFWRDATLGLLELTFDLYPKEGPPLTLKAKRNSVRTGEPDQKALEAADAYFQSLTPPIAIDSFDGIIYWVDPPTGDWGAIDCPPEGKGRSQRALLDQMLAHHTYAHEIGHVAGYQHAYGASNLSDPVYKDDYCVMGNDNQGYCTLPVLGDIDRLPHHPELWLGTRLASAANSYRCHSGFRVSPMIRHAAAGVEQMVRLFALSEAEFGQPVLLTISSGSATFTVEFRANTGWDSGVAAAVVVHSLDYRQVPSPFTEVRPPWYEGSVSAPWSGSYRSPDKRFTLNVLDVAADGKSILIQVAA